MSNNKYQNKIQDQRLDNMEKHLSTINDEMGLVKIDMATIKTNVCWLKKFFWVVAVASISGLIAGLLNLLFK